MSGDHHHDVMGMPGHAYNNNGSSGISGGIQSSNNHLVATGPAFRKSVLSMADRQRAMEANRARVASYGLLRERPDRAFIMQSEASARERQAAYKNAKDPNERSFYTEDELLNPPEEMLGPSWERAMDPTYRPRVYTEDELARSLPVDELPRELPLMDVEDSVQAEVHASVLASEFGDKKITDLDSQQRMRVDAAAHERVQMRRKENTSASIVSVKTLARFLHAVSENTHFKDKTSGEIRKAVKANYEANGHEDLITGFEGLKLHGYVSTVESEKDYYVRKMEGNGTGMWSALTPDMIGSKSGGLPGSRAQLDMMDNAARDISYAQLPAGVKPMDNAHHYDRSTDVWTNAYQTATITSTVYILWQLGMTMKFLETIMPLQNHEHGTGFMFTVMRFKTQPLDVMTHFVRARTMVHSTEAHAGAMTMYGIAAQNTIDYLRTPPGRLVFSTIVTRWAVALQLTRCHLTVTSILGVRNRFISYRTSVHGREVHLTDEQLQTQIGHSNEQWNVLKKFGFYGMEQGITKLYNQELDLPGDDFTMFIPPEYRLWSAQDPKNWRPDLTGKPNTGGPPQPSSLPIHALSRKWYELDPLPVGSRGPETPDVPPLRSTTTIGRWVFMPSQTGTEHLDTHKNSNSDVTHYNSELDAHVAITRASATMNMGFWTDPVLDNACLQHAGDRRGNDWFDRNEGVPGRFVEEDPLRGHATAKAHRARIRKLADIRLQCSGIDDVAREWKITPLGKQFFSWIPTMPAATTPITMAEYLSYKRAPVPRTLNANYTAAEVALAHIQALGGHGRDRVGIAYAGGAAAGAVQAAGGAAHVPFNVPQGVINNIVTALRRLGLPATVAFFRSAILSTGSMSLDDEKKKIQASGAADFARLSRATEWERLSAMLDMATFNDLTRLGGITQDMLKLMTMETPRAMIAFYENSVPIPPAFIAAIPHETHMAHRVVAVKGGSGNMVMLIGHAQVAEAIMPIENWWNAQFTAMFGPVIKNDKAIHQIMNAFVDKYDSGGAPFCFPATPYGRAIRDEAGNSTLRAGYHIRYVGPWSNQDQLDVVWDDGARKHIDISGKFHPKCKLLPAAAALWHYPTAEAYRAVFQNWAASMHGSFTQMYEDPTALEGYNTVCSRTWSKTFKSGILQEFVDHSAFGEWTLPGSGKYRCGMHPPPRTTVLTVNNMITN